jgi:hypothetical protein
MSPSARAGESLASRALIALMRAVPALFTVGWLAATVVWLAQGRLGRALVALAVAVIRRELRRADRVLQPPLSRAAGVQGFATFGS